MLQGLQPFKAQWHQMVTLESVQCHPVLTYILNFWHSGTLALIPEDQSARMSEIQNVSQTQMAKCNQLTLLPFKGLSHVIITNDNHCASLVNVWCFWLVQCVLAKLWHGQVTRVILLTYWIKMAQTRFNMGSGVVRNGLPPFRGKGRKRCTKPGLSLFCYLGQVFSVCLLYSGCTQCFVSLFFVICTSATD